MDEEETSVEPEPVPKNEGPSMHCELARAIR